ncbi:MAG: acyl-CoA dehydrogenase family protein [candidate division WOR-3 bacterium]|nr:MAG: acyl-CoA dehydrogenase family protein [candidate division WOR-3 bacterium]
MKLNQECTMLQTELRKFAQQVILDKVAELDTSCGLPSDNIQRLAEMGILGASVPEDMDGAALECIGLVVSIEEIARVCSSTATIIAAHNALFTYPILKYGSDAQKKKYLPPAATGEQVGSWALPETNEITVSKQNDTFTVNGRNPFVLNAGFNGPLILVVPTGDQPETMTAFVVDPGNKQIEMKNTHNTLGLKAAGIGALTFNDLVLTPRDVLGTVDGGRAVLETARDYMKILTAAISLGIAQGATDEAIKYGKERIQFGQPITTFGMVREKIALMATNIEAARNLTYEAAQQFDAAADYHKAAAVAKYYAGRSAIDSTNEAIQIFGGYGYMKDYPVERYFRDAQVINVLCSTPADDKEFIAKHTIG